MDRIGEALWPGPMKVVSSREVFRGSEFDGDNRPYRGSLASSIISAGNKPMTAISKIVRPESAVRHPYADNLKSLLVVGVIIGHAVMAWTGIGNWVFTEPRVREPMMSILSMFMIVAMFAMALFFFVAGMFTPRSLARKGPRRFLMDRTLRLDLPMLIFVVVISPVVEYVDPENAGWEQGFWAFTRHIWWPPAPGPTWFLGVLLLFSVIYAVVRTIRPVSPPRGPLRARQLVSRSEPWPPLLTRFGSWRLWGKSDGASPWVRRRAGWPVSSSASLRRSEAGCRSARRFPGPLGGRPA